LIFANYIPKTQPSNDNRGWLPVLSLAAKFMPSLSSTLRAKKANLPLLATAAACVKKVRTIFRTGKSCKLAAGNG
jgi:hypothetical protein